MHQPQTLHQPHPNSKVGQDFHSVPYPLSLLPYDSWHKLHHPAHVYPSLPFRCPVCTREREATPHIRKTFLVAERLAWDLESVSIGEKEQNEELTWAVNYELGIIDPYVEDSVQVPGGRQSQKNSFHPYQNEYEMKQALKLIFTSENITNTSWSLWIGMQMDLQGLFSSITAEDPGACIDADSAQRGTQSQASCSSLHIEEVDLTKSPERTLGSPIGVLATPPASLEHHRRVSRKPKGPASTQQHPAATALWVTLADEPTDRPPPSHGPREIVSYKTLRDFYSLLDQIEQTSFVGARFLEAYAERLRGDMCRDCWLKRYVDLSDSELTV